MDRKDIRKKYQITEYCHQFLKEHIRENDICIDATAGNGFDTEFLCSLTGPGGRVYAFDIQQQALEHTKERLQGAGYDDCAVLISASHERMAEYVKEEVGAVVFNFGYLPGGDHRIATTGETSVAAIRQGMELLRTGGVMSLCIYSGGDTGYEEKEQILGFLQELDPKKWLVIATEYLNRKNHPPMPVFVIRMK